jgi:hypothetical protein
LALIHKLEDGTRQTICACAWSGDDNTVSDGVGRTQAVFNVADDGKLSEVHTWKPAEAQVGKPFDRVPVGGTQLGVTVKGDIPVSVGLNGQMYSYQRWVVLVQPTCGHYYGHSAAVAGVVVDHVHRYLHGDTDGTCRFIDMRTDLSLGTGGRNDDLMYVVHGGAISGLATTASGSLPSGWDDKVCYG